MNKLWGEIDRRGYMRVSVKNTELWIKRKKDKDLRISEIGFVKDISMGGISFYSSPEDLNMNDTVEMHFRLHHWGHLDLTGRVVHIQKTTYNGEKLWIYGAEFVKLDSVARKIIKDYVLEKLSLDRFFKDTPQTAT
ncbi:MAG: PilZ domain-containing protein [Bacillota bacterium]